MRKISCLLSLFFLVFLLSSCASRAVLFPEDNYEAPVKTQASNLEDPKSIHFYIQGTEFMSGFISDNLYKKTPRALYDTAQSLWPNANKSYYRFDYATRNEYKFFPEYKDSRHGADAFFPNWINENAFINESSLKAFYSYEWMRHQTGTGMRPQNYERERGGEYGDYFDKDYLLYTIKQLDKESLSVVITDLTDSGFEDNSNLLAAFEDYLSEKSSLETNSTETNKRAISIIQIISSFDGNIYIPEHVLENQPLIKTDLNALKYSAHPFNGKRPYYILIFGDEATNTAYCKKLKETIDSNEVTYLLMGNVTADSSRILEGSEESIVNVVTSGVFNNKEKDNLDVKNNDYLYYYFMSENGKLTLETPLPDNGVDDFSKNIDARVVEISGIREDVENYYEEIKDSSAPVTAKVLSIDKNTIKTEITANKQLLEDAAFSASIPKLRSIIEIYIDFDKYKAPITIIDKSRSIIDKSTDMSREDKIDDYGKGTISLDNLVTPLWEKYIRQADERVGYMILYIKANKNN